MKLLTVDASEHQEVIVRFVDKGRPVNAIKLTCQPKADTIGASPLSPNQLTITGIKSIQQFKDDSYILNPLLNKKKLGMFVITRIPGGQKGESPEEKTTEKPDARHGEDSKSVASETERSNVGETPGEQQESSRDSKDKS